mgnify:CR=1 FL=1
MQFKPFPKYPLLQVQLKLPIVFVQFASREQSFVPKIHSSISILMNYIKKNRTPKE